MLENKLYVDIVNAPGYGVVGKRDDFRNDNPGDYLAGFPWHPHRGIETITYVLAGSVDHGRIDSLNFSAAPNLVLGATTCNQRSQVDRRQLSQERNGEQNGDPRSQSRCQQHA